MDSQNPKPPKLILDPQLAERRLQWVMNCLDCSFPRFAQDAAAAVIEAFRNPPLEHYEEINQLCRFWASKIPPHLYAGYVGPWIEHYWARHIDLPLTEWYPLVPIFLPWTDALMSPLTGLHKEVPESLLRILRNDVLYVTVAQHDCGIFDELVGRRNIVVLSAGGMGDIPIPLLIKPLFNDSIRFVGMPRDLWLSFPGKLRRKGLRSRVRDMVLNSTALTKALAPSRRAEWPDVLFRSRFVLCPGGFGRTSFRLYEALQAGAIPIVIYDDIPWLPYNLQWSEFSVVMHISEFPTVLDRIRAISSEKETQMRKRIHEIVQSHFTFEGVIEQIRQLFANPTSNSSLICSRRPRIRCGNIRFAPPPWLRSNAMADHTDCAWRSNWVLKTESK